MSAKELGSAIKHKKLNDFIDQKLEQQLNKESNLLAHIDDCLASFPDSERTQQQADVAKKLADNVENIAVLAGAAGCGKTKIALEWAKLRNAQQIFWVCPRVQICQGLFNELSVSDSPYLQGASIEIHTGEFKYTNNYNRITPENEYFSGDIVITTIDQILGTVISHSKADRLLNFLRAHVVFDEFHEYINMPAFNLLFSELVESKKSLATGCNTLLVSATPNYFYLENMLDLYIDDQYGDVVEMPSFNTSQYQLDFVQYDETQQDETNPLYKTQPINTFVISNTAQTAQQSFIKNQSQENSILLHSKFKKSDKQSLFEKTFNSFKRDGSKEFELLRSGPIVQASLNISCDYMVSEITNAENCLQRLGRLDRFGKNKNKINKYTIAIPDTLHKGKGTGALARFLSSRHYSLASTKAWYEFLTNTNPVIGRVLTLADIYTLYKTFYTQGHATKAMESDLLTAMKASVTTILSKVTEPQTHAPKKKKEQKRTKISNNSLRGNSRFVQMAICDVSNAAKPQIQDEYAYAIPVHENDSVDNLTMSLDMMRNTGLIDYAAQKHARIDETSIIIGIPAKQINIRKTLLESYAKDPEYPIYLSYTPSELSQKLGETSAHEEAIYYAVCDKQAVGTMSIKQLNRHGD